MLSGRSQPSRHPKAQTEILKTETTPPENRGTMLRMKLSSLSQVVGSCFSKGVKICEPKRR
jgi:hypothetical protein